MLFAALLALAAPAAAPTPVLVELFTSEGCSSCPPADRLLARLAAEQPVAGALVVPLSLHVDYWNRLGWTDPFSSRAFTARQASYAGRLGERGGVYTPQAVVNGEVALVGSDEGGLRRAVAGGARTAHAAVRVGSDGPGPLRVQVTGAREGAEVLLAIVEDRAASDVTRGENAGRRLAHVAVARSLDVVGRADAAGAFDATVRVPAGPGLSAFAFVQEAGAGRVLGVSSPRALPVSR